MCDIQVACYPGIYVPVSNLEHDYDSLFEYDSFQPCVKFSAKSNRGGFPPRAVAMSFTNRELHNIYASFMQFKSWWLDYPSSSIWM
jgi:hypothetical protein